jgi:hypothetical protein
VAAGPDQRPDQEVLFAPEEVLPIGGSAAATGGPAVPGPAAALDLGAVSDYVPALDDGLALDYGPMPDNEAARDYGKAIDCAVPPELSCASESAAPAPGPGLATPGQVPPAEDLWAPGLAAAQVSPATYWRRRLAALAVGIAVLTVLVWAVSGMFQGTGQATGHGVQPSAGPGAGRGRPDAAHGHKGGNRSVRHNTSHSGRGGHPAQRSAQSLPEPAAGRARTVSTLAGHPAAGALSGVSDVLTMAGTRQQKGSAAPRAPHQPAARAPEHPAMVRAPGPRVPACGRGDVVLSLSSPRYWYQRGRWPLFGVAAVSTAARPCRFNMGSRLATVVVASGRTRIWGSADCVHGSGSQSVVLSRGVPAVRWIYWDRATSSPGCRPPHLPVRQGAYTAIAFDGQLSSQVLVIILGRPGTSLP